jgi:hypothetical protein
MPRSLKVRVECLKTVTLAVKHAAFPTQRALAEDLGLALSTVRNFLTGKPVYYSTFTELCQRLSLEWQEIADLGNPASTQPLSSGKLQQTPKRYPKTQLGM